MYKARIYDPTVGERPTATSAAMVFRHADGRFLVVPHDDGVGIPGGKIERFETSASAAIREALEESGQVVSECAFLLQAQAGPHLCDCFVARHWVDASWANDGKDDWRLARWVPLSELLAPEARFPVFYALMADALEARHDQPR